MARKTPVIQDRAVIGKATEYNPIGEAPHGEVPPMTFDERLSMMTRLGGSISQLMDEAEMTYQSNCFKEGTRELDPEYMTRLSTNEFFFYTQEPLTLQEFETLQNKIAVKAKDSSPGVQLVLGSFAVKTEDNIVMNVTPHITCGDPPEVHLLVKNHTSSIDVRYKIPDGKEGRTTLAVLDKKNPPTVMPQIKIDGKDREFTFNNIVPCKTPGNTPFLTAVDICLDHSMGVAKTNYNALTKQKPDLLKQPISHMVVSNCIGLFEEQCLVPNVMHVDPHYSLLQCQRGCTQQPGEFQKLAFGRDPWSIIEVAPQKVNHFFSNLKNEYSYKAGDASSGRDHELYTASLDKIQQSEASPNKFQNFKDKYQAYKGDHLKTQILEDLKQRIEEVSSINELKELKEELKNSYESQVLKTAQGWFTEKTGISTSSQRALEGMIKQREEELVSYESKSQGLH